MKHLRFVIVCLLVSGFARNGLAVPRAAESSGKYYLFAAQDLASWHVGGSYRQLKRQIAIGGVNDTLKLNRANFHLGYDVLPWMAVYGVVGNVSPSLSVTRGAESSSAEFGAGLWVNLIDHDLIDNLSTENRIRLQALAQLTRGTPEVGARDLSYTEFHGALTLSLINELDANKQYWPEAVSLFFGPVINYLEGDNFGTRNSDFGLVIGSDVQLSRRVSLSIMYERYSGSDEAFSGSLNVRL